MNIFELKDKLRNLEFEDVFPPYGWGSDTNSLLKGTGIYLGIIIVAIFLGILLGHIFILGVIIWIISGVAILYGIVGMVAGLLRFMKYN